MSEMDSSMSLFGTEFSLFGEDLLFSPPAALDEESVVAPQDGLKVVSVLPAAPVWQTETSHDVLSDKQPSGDLLEDWLDTRIDILDLMSEQDASFQSQPFMDLGFEIPMEEHTGLFALKIEAEKAFLELSTTDLEQPKVVQPLPSQGTDNVYDQGLGLLELLTADVSPQQTLGVSDFAGLDLAPGADTSGPLLSPMSPEDVESILSSGPPSPQNGVIAEESFESLMSSVMGSDVSFNDSSIMEEITPYEEAPTSIDLALLSQMVMSGNNTAAENITSDSDSDYQPEISIPHSGGRGARPKVKKEPTSSETVLHKVKDRKLRKKQQNKDAATRYRQKKKIEQDIINDEVAQLEGRNTELKDKVDQMSKEISYLKSLLTDVYKARAKTSKSK